MANAEYVKALEETKRGKAELEAWTNSELYKFYCKVLEDRMAEINKDLLVAEDIGKVRFLQGEHLGISIWRRMPEIMLERISVDEQQILAAMAAEKEEA